MISRVEQKVDWGIFVSTTAAFMVGGQAMRDVGVAKPLATHSRGTRPGATAGQRPLFFCDSYINVHAVFSRVMI